MSTRDLGEQRRRALELHLAGASYAAIAQALGYAAKSRAHTLVQEALAELEAPDDVEMAATEVLRLNAMLQGLWPKARKGDVQAVDRVLAIEHRRRQIDLAAIAAARPETRCRGAQEQARPAASHPRRPAVVSSRGHEEEEVPGR